MESVTRFLVEHGYLILVAWVFLNQLGIPAPAMPYLLAAGALAGLGLLNPFLLVALGVAPALPADLIWYEIGRRRGGEVLRSLCRISLEPDSCVRRTETIFAGRGDGTAGHLSHHPGLPAEEHGHRAGRAEDPVL